MSLARFQDGKLAGKRPTRDARRAAYHYQDLRRRLVLSGWRLRLSRGARRAAIFFFSSLPRPENEATATTVDRDSMMSHLSTLSPFFAKSGRAASANGN